MSVTTEPTRSDELVVGQFESDGEGGESWTARARCAASAPRGPRPDPDAMFVRGAAQREARAVCFICPVRLECLIEAFDTGMEFGVWGGLTERERRAMVRAAAAEAGAESVAESSATSADAGAPRWRERLRSDAQLRERFEQERRTARIAMLAREPGGARSA